MMSTKSEKPEKSVIKFTFDHNQDYMWKATGISKEQLEDIRNRYNALVKMANKKSQYIQMLSENFSKEEIILILVMLKS